MVHPDAELDDSVSVGPFTVIEEGVKIGAGTRIGPNVLIGKNTQIGESCQVFHGASIGGDPQIAGFKDVLSSVEIGEHTVIREYVTIHRSMYENKTTRIGHHCLLMAYAHIGHDCQIGDYNTTTAAVSISGDCIVGKHVYWGNGSTIRQGLTVCDEVMIGMGAVVSKNITESGVYVGIPAQKMGK